MLSVGYTGPEEGMTPAQAKALRGLLRSWKLVRHDEVLVLHHGDCVGGDIEAQDIAVEEEWWVEIWPPDNDRKRGWGERRLPEAEHTDTIVAVHQPKPYLDRDWDIAAQDVLVATPKQKYEPEGRERGGTWATVTRARRQGTPVRIIWPDGSETVEK